MSFIDIWRVKSNLFIDSHDFGQRLSVGLGISTTLIPLITPDDGRNDALVSHIFSFLHPFSLFIEPDVKEGWGNLRKHFEKCLCPFKETWDSYFLLQLIDKDGITSEILLVVIFPASDFLVIIFSDEKQKRGESRGIECPYSLVCVKWHQMSWQLMSPEAIYHFIPLNCSLLNQIRSDRLCHLKENVTLDRVCTLHAVLIEVGYCGIVVRYFVWALVKWRNYCTLINALIGNCLSTFFVPSCLEKSQLWKKQWKISYIQRCGKSKGVFLFHTEALIKSLVNCSHVSPLRQKRRKTLSKSFRCVMHRFVLTNS